MKGVRKMNIPNKITISRILLIPFFVIVMMFDFGWGTMSLFGATMPVHHFVGALILLLLQRLIGWMVIMHVSTIL